MFLNKKLIIFLNQLIILTEYNLTSIKGLSFLSHLTFSIVLAVSVPLKTLPKTVCLLSSQGQGIVVMKNCDPFVFGPQFAILSVKGISCFKCSLNSSSNSSFQIDSP